MANQCYDKYTKILTTMIFVFPV